jgi:hypothetical protein
MVMVAGRRTAGDATDLLAICASADMMLLTLNSSCRQQSIATGEIWFIFCEINLQTFV